MTELHKNHRARLRGRYQSEGLDGFEDHMILELLLFQAIPRVDTNPIGHRLLERFGSLENVFSASVEDLCGVEGVGPKTAEMLKSVGDHMLFRILDGCSLDEENPRFALAAEYHMRNLAAGDVTLFSRGTVVDYTSDGTSDGLCELILADLREQGMEEYALVVKTDGTTDGLPCGLKDELKSGRFSAVFQLAGTELEKTDL